MYVFIYKACINVMEILFTTDSEQSIVSKYGVIWIRLFLRFQMVQNGKSSYHGLALGHLLVFRYLGNSHFDVLIFDATAT
ncbi:hypothetical protein CFP56_002930 [Quercus suber]|uniref:Uncharacterized protein n=1 Tax=Quercus suber TaxID=58331 RepID=A0AAW0IJY8_QUESU